MPVNLINDLPLIRDYIADRVRAQVKVNQQISAIEIGFRLDQACHVALNFDTREKHERDGTWTEALDGPTLELPHWHQAFENAGGVGISFVLLTGETRTLPPGSDEETVAGVFGETLRAIALDAFAAGLFDPLPLREDCQLDIEEFDGMWGWPNETFDSEAIDRANEIRRLTPVQLPI